MLLGNFLLSQFKHKDLVAQIWREREKTEREAASLFGQLAQAMGRVSLPEGLVEMAQQASEDEVEHAGRCRSIIESCGEEVNPLSARERGLLGPAAWGTADRALYTSAAMGCITETLSTALLLEMKKRLDSEIIEKTVRSILGDEVNHSRLGWAHLAYVSQSRDVAFLGEYLPNMLEPVLIGESEEASEQKPQHCDLYGYGVLPRQTVQEVFKQTLQEVILPGFEEFGVPVVAANRWTKQKFSA